MKVIQFCFKTVHNIYDTIYLIIFTSSFALESKSLLIGSKVQARYKGRALYYSGVIEDIHRTTDDHIYGYTIRYNDGDMEKYVHIGLIRSLIQDSYIAPDDKPHDVEVEEIGSDDRNENG